MSPVKDSASVVCSGNDGKHGGFLPTQVQPFSFAGMGPDNNESARKKNPRETTHGIKCLKAMLADVGWTA
jgi:hypothetical protein